MEQHRSRGGDNDDLDPASEKKFSDDQSGLNRFTEPDIVSDEQVHTGQVQGFRQRKQLISIEANTRPERGLKQLTIGR
ncbi:hypothetical protein SF83666_c33570 [Sinorhizobium fredii CCBAU 83666]|nr:hypothetical protein SF83666_c33570 [Sinorhizobium fredii CCBAU 83666]